MSDISHSDRALLRAYGYSDEMIDDMNPTERAAELADAKNAGVDAADGQEPRTYHYDASPPRVSLRDEEILELNAAVSDLRHRNERHKVMWFVAAAIVLPTVLMLWNWPKPRDSLDSLSDANRCQKLWVIRAAADTLYDPEDKDARTDALLDAINAAIKDCTLEDFRERPAGPE